MDGQVMLLSIQSDAYNAVFAEADQIRFVFVKLLNDFAHTVSDAAFFREFPAL